MQPRLAVLAASALAAAALAGLPVQAASLARGTALVQRNCALCHAAGKTGSSPNPEAPPLRTLHRYITMDALAEALQRGLLVKHPSMPQMSFRDDQIEDIMAYIRGIQAADPDPRAPI